MDQKTHTQDPITHAAHLLREAAQELKTCHTLQDSSDWTQEPDAKAAYDEHIAAAEALEHFTASIGAGGVSGPLMGASLAANAGGEPVARVNDDGFIVEIGDLLIAPGTKLYTHTSPPEVMAGWKWVPVEPTDEMLAAAHDGDREYTLRNFGDVMTVMQGPYDHWAAMLAAAPPLPASEAGEA